MGSGTHFNESDYWHIIHQRIKCVFSFTVFLRANGYQIYIFLINVNMDGCLHASVYFYPYTLLSTYAWASPSINISDDTKD